MARINYGENSTITKEKNNETIVKSNDRVLDTNNVIKKFDNTHNTDKFDKMYSDLGVEEYFSDGEERIQFDNEIEDIPQNEKRHVDIKNPFTKKIEESKPLAFDDIIDIPKKSPTLEIKNFTPVPIKPVKKSLSKRIKLWLVTGICCLVLLCTGITVAALNIGSASGSGANVVNQSNVETGELIDEHGFINNTGQEINKDNISTIGKTTKAPKPIVKPVVNTNVWDKICAFFSRLFGR